MRKKKGVSDWREQVLKEGWSGDLRSLRHGPRDEVKGVESAVLFTYFFWKVDILPNMSSSQAQGAPQHQGSLPTFIAPAANPDACTTSTIRITVYPQSGLHNGRGFWI